MSHLARLLAALAICLASMAAADTTAFTPGEQVVYRASYLGIPAGTIRVTVGAEFADSPGVWPILFVARSDVGLFFYPIRDKLVLRWDAENVQTLGMEMWADENHKRRHLKILFDHAEGKAKVFRQADGQEPVQTILDVPSGSADVGSALYLLRTRSLEPGTELTLPVVTPSKQFPLRAVVEGRERLKTPLGEQSTVRVRLTTDFSGKLKAKSDLVIFFTEGEAHIPVRIEADLALGTVVVEAVEYHSGLRMPVRPKAAARTEVR
jgi:Protein of unknown function (DUF3108)